MDQMPLDKIEFESLWSWLRDHPGCVVEAGGEGFKIADHDTLHWLFYDDVDGYRMVQVALGKAAVVEFFIDPQTASWVQVSAQDEGQALFEVFGEEDGRNLPLCFFLMAHGMDRDPEPPRRHLTH